MIVRTLLQRKEWTPEAVEKRLGWQAGRYEQAMSAPGNVPLEECFKLLLFAIESGPANQPEEGPEEASEASSLPDAFYARSPYRSHAAPMQPDEIWHLTEDATPPVLRVLGLLLKCVKELKAQKSVDTEEVKKLLNDYLEELSKPEAEDMSTVN